MGNPMGNYDVSSFALDFLCNVHKDVNTYGVQLDAQMSNVHSSNVVVTTWIIHIQFIVLYM